MPNPFNQGNYEFMPPPPPKAKSLPPPKRHDYERAEPRQNGLRFQPNRLFESLEELNDWIGFAYKGKKVKIIKTWPVTNLACRIEVEQDDTSAKTKK